MGRSFKLREVPSDSKTSLRVCTIIVHTTCTYKCGNPLTKTMQQNMYLHNTHKVRIVCCALYTMVPQIFKNRGVATPIPALLLLYGFGFLPGCMGITPPPRPPGHRPIFCRDIRTYSVFVCRVHLYMHLLLISDEALL